ncbi:MAG: diacylglycerol kinase family protein [Cryomorphaceae bacterium]|nr:MAG: diacylglycerol kinase family protein [Cryomorphaceae bacterium]|tara:strand:+ start:59 stop:433 length:375 start_codon:yes stop_codon:yes gene_type:complete
MKFIIRRLKGIIIAINGMFFLLKNEEAIKVQSFVFLIIIALGFYFEITSKEWIIHIILIGFILTTEALNTVAEKICDLINPKYDERIKLIKDISAGAVSFAVLSSLIILLIIYFPYIKQLINSI